jgi:hypothetical protein
MWLAILSRCNRCKGHHNSLLLRLKDNSSQEQQVRERWAIILIRVLRHSSCNVKCFSKMTWILNGPMRLERQHKSMVMCSSSNLTRVLIWGDITPRAQWRERWIQIWLPTRGDKTWMLLVQPLNRTSRANFKKWMFTICNLQNRR